MELSQSETDEERERSPARHLDSAVLNQPDGMSRAEPNLATYSSGDN